MSQDVSPVERVARRFQGRFKEPRGGFPAEAKDLALDATRDAEGHGHDLSDWKLLYKSSPEGGFTSACVKCGMKFLLQPEQQAGSSGILKGGGWVFYVDTPRTPLDVWENHVCEVQPTKILRGVFVRMDNPNEFLAQGDAAIVKGLLAIVTKKGLGEHWTNPQNRSTVESFALKHQYSNPKFPALKTGVPVILHAEFRREDQHRNYKPGGFWQLVEFTGEQEQAFSNHEVVRLSGLEWHDGVDWKMVRLNGLKVKTGDIQGHPMYSYDRTADYDVLSPPLDLTPNGAKAWVNAIRQAFLNLPPGSPERTRFLDEMDRKFGYVAFLFKGKKALHAYLKAEGDKLKAMLDTVGD